MTRLKFLRITLVIGYPLISHLDRQLEAHQYFSLDLIPVEISDVPRVFQKLSRGYSQWLVGLADSVARKTVDPKMPLQTE